MYAPITRSHAAWRSPPASFTASGTSSSLNPWRAPVWRSLSPLALYSRWMTWQVQWRKSAEKSRYVAVFASPLLLLAIDFGNQARLYSSRAICKALVYNGSLDKILLCIVGHRAAAGQPLSVHQTSLIAVKNRSSGIASSTSSFDISTITSSTRMIPQNCSVDIEILRKVRSAVFGFTTVNLPVSRPLGTIGVRSACSFSRVHPVQNIELSAHKIQDSFLFVKPVSSSASRLSSVSCAPRVTIFQRVRALG